MAGLETDREHIWVRYVCPECRRVWDCSFAVYEELGEDPLHMAEQFDDRFVVDLEGLEVPGDEGMSFPWGPSAYLVRRAPPGR